MLPELRVRIAALLTLILAAMVPGLASAHPLAPALLQIREQSDGKAEVSWKTSVLQVRGSKVAPSLPPECKPVGTSKAVEEGESVVEVFTVDCGPGGLVGKTVGVTGLGDGKNDSLLRIALADGRVLQEVLRVGDAEFTIPETGRPSSVFTGYIQLGFDHILTGLDHLLFVFGLLLLATSTRLLIETVTAFTVGHSITLSLAALGIAQVPSGPVEVLIALSIFILAVELARGERTSPTLLRRFPWVMAFLFGLLHGLGFAGALREIGLPPDDIPLSLFSFNVGIEAGQLTFVFVVLLAGFVLRRVLERLPAWSERIPVYGIGCLSVYWVLERIADVLR
ncbi:MAG: HupE/UreJ family protein [Candidatus Binatia bacterium]|nr:HupE/UreJ family protein [Candidatus Binatia bacterium]